MDVQEQYGASRDEFMKLRGILCERLRRQITEPHRIDGRSVVDAIQGIDAVNSVILKYDAKPVGRPKKDAGDE